MFGNVEDIRPASALAVAGTADADSTPSNAPRSKVAAVISDELIAGLYNWPVWAVMGWDDIRQRYRRSILGPFWITMSMAVFIFVLSIIYSRLFHTPLESYMPFLTAGYITWGFISSTTNESCNVFLENSRIIKQIKLPYSTYAMRVLWRNFIVYIHTIIVYIPVAIYFRVEPTPMTLYVFPGLFLVVVNQLWVTLVLGILSARYRDLQPIVVTAIQLAMFATPIMWMAGSAADLKFVADVNPLYHLIELVRAPLLGMAPQPQSWLVAIAMAVVGWAAATALMVRAARRIVYWL
jgi:lipopolysaccharide transport system permease protein